MLLENDKFHELLWNYLNLWGPIFGVCQFFTGSWGIRGLVGWGRGVKRRITPGKFILFEMSYFSLQQFLQRDWDKGRFENVFYKVTTC